MTVYPLLTDILGGMRDTTDDLTTNRRAYLKATGAVGLAGAIGLAGCAGADDTATGTLATAVKDAPGDIEDFESCVVTVEGIWIKPAGEDAETDDDVADGAETTDEFDTAAQDTVTEQDEADVDEDEGRTYYEFEESQQADLVQLQDGASKLLGDQEVPVGSYQYLQLDVSNVEGTLVDGGEAQVDTPGNAPLQFKHAFEVRDGQRTVFTADFTPVKRGRTNRYLFQPVASGTSVSYEQAQTETGAAPETDTATDTATETTSS